MTLALVINLAGFCKELNPDLQVVIGGLHATLTAGEILRTFQAVDIVVRREGKRTIKQVIDALVQGSPLAEVKGISFRQKGKLLTTESREFIPDLDEPPTWITPSCLP